MDTTTLIIGVMAGAFGAGYFVYGKKQREIVPIISGVGLCILPYCIDNVALLICACLVLAIAPFVIRR